MLSERLLKNFLIGFRRATVESTNSIRMSLKRAFSEALLHLHFNAGCQRGHTETIEGFFRGSSETLEELPQRLLKYFDIDT